MDQDPGPFIPDLTVVYYECPLCSWSIPVRSKERPLRVACGNCGTEFNLKLRSGEERPADLPPIEVEPLEERPEADGREPVPWPGSTGDLRIRAEELSRKLGEAVKTIRELEGRLEGSEERNKELLMELEFLKDTNGVRNEKAIEEREKEVKEEGK